MPAAPSPALPTNPAATAGLLATVLSMSQTGIMLLRPLYGGPGAATLTDFAWDYLNPAAQRMLALPERPADSFLTLFPTARAAGVFGFYRDAFLSGQRAQRQNNYQFDRLDGYYHLVAQRQGEVLVVDFTDTNEQPRTAVEEELRQSQARELLARAEAETERNLLQALLRQAPVAIGLFTGDDCVVQTANDPLCAMWGHAPAEVLGRPLLEGVPELRAQGFTDLLREVARTRVPYVGTEVRARLPAAEGLKEYYFNFIYQPLLDGSDTVLGVVGIAVDVTPQVLARQQAEAQQQHTTLLNAGLTQANAQTHANNAALVQAQQQLRQLNEALEARVAERTQALASSNEELQTTNARLVRAQLDLRKQQDVLSQILRQVPAAIATFSGPEHRLLYFNDWFQRLAAGRASQGRTVAEAFPEVVAQGFIGRLDGVYGTGQPFVGTEVPAQLHDPHTGRAELRYLDVACQPLTDRQQRPQGILAFIVDVTNQVRSRRQADTMRAALLGVARRQQAERENVYQLFEQTPAAVCLLRESDHRIEYHNPAYQALFPERSLRGRTVAETQPEAITQGVVALLDKVYESGEPFFGNEVPLTVTPPDGQPPVHHYFNFTFQAYREQGRIVGVSVFAFDVTGQVLARREADQQRGLLTTLFMEAPAPICILDGPQHVYQLVNPAYQQLFPGRELLGHPVAKALPELADTTVPSLLARVYETGETYVAQDLALAIARYEGGPLAERYFTFTYQARRSVAAAIDGILVFAYEVTEQVLARRSTEAGAQRLQLLTDALPALISYVDRERRYRFVNQAYHSWFNREPAALIGRTVREVVGEAAYGNVEQYMDRVLAGERLAFDARMPYREDFVRYIHTDYIPDVQRGEVLGYYALVSDMTDQVLARQQVQELNEQLAATNQTLSTTNHQLTRTNADLDTFVYTASHDLKAPITNLEGLLTALRGQLSAEAPDATLVPRLLEMMDGSIARFQQTLEHLTDISKLQQDDDGSTETVDLPALAEDVRLDLAPLLASTGGQLTFDLDGCSTVHFAAKNLRSILYNLLSNALKYHDPARPAEVLLQAACTDQQVTLTVRDNGLGLTASQQTKVFGLFRRLHTHVEGSGVGLYMVKKMVENAGGTVTVESTPGVGSVFRVELPAAGS